jgi:hypothetical protein
MSRRRRLDQDLIAKQATEIWNLGQQLDEAARLADARYDLLRAVMRENEALRIELISRKTPLVQGGHTAPMTRQRSLTPAPCIDLTKAGDETELMMQPGWSA